MAKGRMVKKARCEDVLSAFMEGARGSVFFTLTTPDVVEVQEIRRRWREMRHWLVRRLGRGAKYVMNYEIHPGGHGWHIHSVWNRYIDLRKHLDKIRSFGFGRVDIRRVDSKGVADYLTKHALKAYAGVSRVLRQRGKASRLRLVNTSRGLPTLDSYTWESDLITKTRRLFNLTKDGGVYSTIMPPERWKACQLAALFSVRDGRELVRFFRNLYSPISADICGYLMDRANGVTPHFVQIELFSQNGPDCGAPRESPLAARPLAFRSSDSVRKLAEPISDGRNDGGKRGGTRAFARATSNDSGIIPHDKRPGARVASVSGDRIRANFDTCGFYEVKNEVFARIKGQDPVDANERRGLQC